MSTGRRLIIFSFILLPVILVAVYSFLQARKRLIDHIYEERRTMSFLSARVLHERFEHLEDIGVSLATRPVFRQYMSEAKFDKAISLMTDVPSNFSFIRRAIIADTNGQVRTCTPALPAGSITDQSGLDWYKGFRQADGIFLSPVYLDDEQPANAIIALAVPIIGMEGRRSGILLLQINIKEILAWSSDVNIGRSGFVYIVDQRGHIASSPAYKEMDSLIDYSSVPAVQKAMRGESNVEVLYNPISEENSLFAYEPVTPYGWSVVVQQEANDALRVKNRLGFILPFYSIVILLAGFSGWVIIREINRRKKTEDRLRGYLHLVDQTQVLARDMHDHVVYWNAGMEKLCGWQKENVIGRNVHTLLQTVFPEPIEDIKNKLLRTDSWQGELIHTKRNGDKITVYSNWLLNRDANGKPVTILETNNDITALKLTQESLRASQESARFLVDNVKDYAIYMLDTEGKVASWNRGAERIKGYNEEEIIGQPLSLFYITEDVVKDIPTYNLQMARAKGVYASEGWRRRKDDSRFWASVEFTALWDDQKELRGYIKVTHDITDRKAAERQVQFLSRQVEQSNDAIYVVDTERRITSWNKGAEKLYGYNDTEAMGIDSNILLQTELHPDLTIKILQKLSQEDYWAGELKRKSKSGKTIYVRSSTSTIRDDEGHITGYVAVNIDITEQKKLQEQVNYLAELVEQSSDAILSFDLEGRVISWNRGAENLFGFGRQEVVGNKLSRLRLMTLLEDDLQIIFHDLISGRQWQTETDFFRKDGTRFFGAVNANSIKDARGQVNAIIFIIKDISLRKRLEDQLSEYNSQLELKVVERTREISKNEKRFRALIENNYDMISLMDESFRIIYRSPSTVRNMGWGNEEMQQAEATVNFHPDDLAKGREIMKELFDNPGRPMPIIFRNRHKDGHYLWVEGIIVNLLADENVKAIVFNFRDVTDRVNAEERIKKTLKVLSDYQAALDESSIVAITNSKGTITQVNDNFCHISKFNREELIGQNHRLINSGLHSREFFRTLWKTISTGKVWKGELCNRAKDGTIYWVDTTIVPFLDDNDRPYQYIAIRSDITERKNAEKELSQINYELEQRVAKRTAELKKTNEELESFSYSVSHDLRAPLRAVIGFTAILEEEYSTKLDAEALRLTGIIKSSTQRMGSLIDDLLAFSRTGRQNIDMSVIDVQQLVDQLILELTARTEDNRIEWKMDSLPPISGDLSMLRQVWINLLSNAIKYSMNQLSPVIEVGAYEQGNEVVYYIRDNGVGFDSRYASKLFKVFQRLHASSEFEGTGIGLAIVEKIISKHGGRVWAEGEVGKGACFYVTMPKIM